MNRSLSPWLTAAAVPLAVAAGLAGAAAQEPPPSVLTATSEPPPITSLTTPSTTGEPLPEDAGKHRDEALRQEWEALSPKLRGEILEAFRAHVEPALETRYQQYLTQQQQSPSAPNPNFNNGGNGDPPPTGAGLEVYATAYPPSGPAPLAVSFSASADDPYGYVYDFFWDFGDGGWAYGQYTSHSYSVAGTYFATVTATSTSGSTAYATAFVQVTQGNVNRPPQVTLSAFPGDGVEPLTVSLSASAFDPDGWISSYAWDFGDGTGSGGASVSHLYAQAGDYNVRVTVTDNLGASATASGMIRVTPAGGSTDSDGDGLPDRTERKLANHFMPAYFLSFFERPGTGLALFADNPNQQIATQVFPTAPPTLTSYHRVTPLGVAAGKSFVQVDYLTLWNRDDGLALNSACATDIDILSIFGIWSPAFGIGLSGHNLDNERSIFRLVAPAAGGAVNTDPGAYKVDRVFVAAHEDTSTDRSQLYFINPPQGPEVHYGLFASLSKHATYGFWPHGFVSLLPGWAIGAIYGGVSTACFFFPDWCGFLFFIADEVVFDCVVEKHIPVYGAVEPRSDLRINVGEQGNPLPGASFILVPALQGKLDKVFRIP